MVLNENKYRQYSSFLNEYTKKQLLKRAKTPGYYRLGEKMREIPKEEIEILATSSLAANNDLIITYRVKDYRVNLRLINFLFYFKNYLRQNMRVDSNIRSIIRSGIRDSFNKCQMQVSCTCADFNFRFSYASVKLNYGYQVDQTIPAKITNPKRQGSICKHIGRILTKTDWWIERLTTLVYTQLKYNPSLFDL